MAHKDEAHRNERNERIVRRLEIEANQGVQSMSLKRRLRSDVLV